jgi:hypothetical protein
MNNNTKRKTMKNQLYNIEYIKCYLDNMPLDMKILLHTHCNIIIVEKQYKDNMKYLSFIIGSMLLERCLPDSKLIFYSALFCKRTFNIPIENSNGKNKKKVIEFICNTSEGKKLIGANKISTHNECDACLILNTYLKGLKKYYITDNMEIYTCPGCGGDARKYFVKKEDSIYHDQPFLSCRAEKDPSSGYYKSCDKLYNFVTMDKADYKKFTLKNKNTDSNLGKRVTMDSVWFEDLLRQMDEKIDRLIEASLNAP